MTLLTTFSENEDFLELSNHHHLCGYFFDIKKNDQCKKAYLLNTHRNQLFLEELEALDKNLNGEFNIAILKGLSLLDDVYLDLGKRFMSDMDFLVEKNNLDLMINVLEKNGYENIDEEKWFANDFKRVFVKQREGIEIVIELHTRLFYHVDDFELKTKHAGRSLSNIRTLEKEDQFIHLCGHLGFQHNFLKLYWLVDIYLYFEKYHDDINWKMVLKKSNKMKLNKSVSMCLWILNRYFDIKLDNELKTLFSVNSIRSWKGFLTYQFLINPTKFSIRYFILKHLNKDNFIENLRYNLGWLKDRLGFVQN